MMSNQDCHNFAMNCFSGNQCMWWHYLGVGTSTTELHGLALDAKRGLLYYTDYSQGVIAEITTSGSNERVIYSDRSKRPRAIIVDSKRR